MTDTIQRNYKMPVDLALALRKFCNDNSMSEASFVRNAIAAKLLEGGVVVTAHLQHGGRRRLKKIVDKPPKKRGIFSRS